MNVKAAATGTANSALSVRRRVQIGEIPTPSEPLEYKSSPDSTVHFLVLLVFFLFSFVLRSKLGLFLLFLFSFISFPLIAHIRFSLLEPTFPKWRLLSNVTEPTDRYRTPFQQPHARSTPVIRVLRPNNVRHSRAFSQLRAVVLYAAQTVTVVPNA